MRFHGANRLVQGQKARSSSHLQAFVQRWLIAIALTLARKGRCNRLGLGFGSCYRAKHKPSEPRSVKPQKRKDPILLVPREVARNNLKSKN
jgi:hypothetical protein